MRRHYKIKGNGLIAPLFSIEETADQSLIIVPRLGGNHQEGREDPVAENRLSVHFGTNSPTYSTVKHHYRLEDGSIKTTAASLTSVAKIPGKFSAILSAITPSPVSRTFLEADAEPGVIFGELPLLGAQICYSLFIGHPEADFNYAFADQAGLKRAEFLIGRFKLIVIWEAIDLPPTRLARIQVPATFRPEELLHDERQRMQRIMDGEDSLHATGYHVQAHEVMIYSMLQSLLADGNPDDFMAFDEFETVKGVFEARKAFAYDALKATGRLHYITDIPNPYYPSLGPHLAELRKQREKK